MPGTEEGWLEVPIDYANPDDGMFRIYVTRRLATGDRIGSLLVNPGGPGFGGSDFGTYAEQIYGEAILERFDVIGFDPRGTGISEPAIDCVDDYDHFYAGYDITPDDDAERQEIIDLAEEYAEACSEKNSEIIQFVGTNNAARDMDSIRRALGEDEISYFGFSYGSELGATWATLFPDTVRAAVLDGAKDPATEGTEHSLQQIAGFEATLATYLAQCSADPSCSFHSDGDAEGAFDQLMLKLDAKPIPSVEGRPNVTRGVALQAVSEAMYSDSSWPQLSDALASARQGDGSGLLALYDAYYQYDGFGWGNELEAFQTISCMDDEERLTVAEDDALAPEFNAVAPRFSPGDTGSYFCTFFPESTDPRVEITGAGAGPIVVCGATGDAATPLQSTRNMAETLEDGRLIVIEADQHTCYGANACADQIIDDYLVDLAIPAEETDCPA
jgi:pimeloyl-ACP methyl ester carboxylesterase